MNFKKNLEKGLTNKKPFAILYKLSTRVDGEGTLKTIQRREKKVRFEELNAVITG